MDPVAAAAGRGAQADPVSRDDPSTAYVYAQVVNHRSELRTRDGGQTWQTLAMPPYTSIRAIQPGDPARLFSARTVYDSSDGGTTWTPAPAGETCMFAIAADPASPTGLRLGCDGWTGYDVHRALDANHLPDADGLFGSPDRPSNIVIMRIRSAYTIQKIINNSTFAGQ